MLSDAGFAHISSYCKTGLHLKFWSACFSVAQLIIKGNVPVFYMVCIKCSALFPVEGTVGETSGFCLGGWSGPRDPVPEGDPLGHRAQMFQHHSELYIQPGGWSRFHCPHGPAHGHGGVLQGHVRAGREGPVTWRGSVLWNRLSPATGPPWTPASISVSSSVQRSQQQPSSQTYPDWRGPTRGQTAWCAGRDKVLCYIKCVWSTYCRSFYCFS